MGLLPCAPMRVADFDYQLPNELIARYPPAERRGSRLLDVGVGLIDRQFSELPALLRPNDLLVFNDSRVIPARLRGRKESGGRVEVLIERIESDRIALVHLRVSKPPKPGGKLIFGDVDARVLGREAALYRLEFATPVWSLLERCGEIPLPPYLGRDAEPGDRERYQTVYARDPGAVAAPTAGLHFDEAMLAETLAMGVQHAAVTLHVGAGTFQSLRSKDVAENRLHSERVRLGQEVCDAVAACRAAGGRVIAVGTTSVRALESAAAGGELKLFHGETDLFILPGFRFHCVDAMLTNFHLPQSSLLMLVAAFAGTGRVLAAYRHAVQQRYRFYSYGDVMFLTPEERA